MPAKNSPTHELAERYILSPAGDQSIQRSIRKYFDFLTLQERLDALIEERVRLHLDRMTPEERDHVRALVTPT